MLTPCERLVATGGVKPTELAPCSADDLKIIERQLGLPIPTSYATFLETIGRGAGEFMSDLSVFFPDLLNNTDAMSKILSECGQTLPNNVFVFIHRYGEQMLYFQLEPATNDPEVFRWSNENPKRFDKLHNSIWQWIEEELGGYEYCLG